MEYKGTLIKTELKELDIAYLRGVLHTYAFLNYISDLIYDYDIVEIAKDDSDFISAIKNNLDFFANEQISLESIPGEKLQTSLRNWLFENITVPEYWITKEVESFYNLLKNITNFKFVYTVNGLDPKSYKFGLIFDFFVLESDMKLFIIYFSYTD